jgi:CSLREA domain-containing protein
VNGTIAANEYGDHTDGQNAKSSGGQTWYMTWDDTNLYVGIANANTAEAAVIYIDRNPVCSVNGGSNVDGNLTGQPYDNTNFSSLPFRADFVTYAKDGYQEYRRADGSGAWTAPTSPFGSYASSGGNVRELSIPWNDITNGTGRPPSFLFFGYVTSATGFVYGQVPPENPGGNIGTSATYTRYYEVTNTRNGASTRPFSVNRTTSSTTPCILVVNQTADTDDTVCNSANCTLREAINAANAHAGPDTIQFNIPGSGVRTISVATGGLPIVSQPTTIDGASQPGYAGIPIIELNGAGAGSGGINGLHITGGSSTVRGLVINSFSGSGIRLATSGGNTVVGNYIGTNALGTAALPNSSGGVAIVSANNTLGGTTAGERNVISGNNTYGVSITGSSSTGNVVKGNYIGTNATGAADLGNTQSGVLIQSANNTVGGTTVGERNIISGNNAGVSISGSSGTGNVVKGNYIGTDATGTATLGNAGVGVSISSSGNTVGGNTAGERNVISGNNTGGVSISGSSGTGNIVKGNYIGTDAAGTADLGNAGVGVSISSANNTVGGTTAGERNVISGNNSNGVQISGSGGTGNVVKGNYIGTDATGTADLGNTFNGVNIISANNTVGGTTAGERNVISGNNSSGVQIGSSSTGNIVKGNYIGINVAGTAALPNGGSGVSISGPNNTVGGTTPGERNVISGNNSSGVSISDLGNVVKGNYIGTDATGTLDLGNTTVGVLISSSGNTVGGTTAGERNVISGNNSSGVQIGSSVTGSVVTGNYIGTDATGTAALGNSGIGVFISFADNRVGGTAVGEANIIAFNSGGGVALSSNAGGSNRIISNSIHSNSGLGIDLGDDGVTLNDPSDADVGPNNRQNVPEITMAQSGASGDTTLTGSIHSTPNTTFTVQFFTNTACDPTGAGEGHTLIGSTTLTTDANGNAGFSSLVLTGTGDLQGQFITATAMNDSTGDTSEFSYCALVPTSGPTTASAAIQWAHKYAGSNSPTLLGAPGLFYDTATPTPNAQISVGNYNGETYGFRGDGSLMWGRTLTFGTLVTDRAPIVPVNGVNTVLVTSGDSSGTQGYLTAINAANGTILWTTTLGQYVVAGAAYQPDVNVTPPAPGCTNPCDLVIVGTFDNTNTRSFLAAYDAADGSLVWQYGGPSSGLDIGPITTVPSVNYGTNTVYFGSTDGIGGTGHGVRAVNTTNGAPVWANIGIGRVPNSDPSLSLDGQTLYIGTVTGSGGGCPGTPPTFTMFALNTSNGIPRTQYSVSDPCGAGAGDFFGAPWPIQRGTGSAIVTDIYATAGSRVYALVDDGTSSPMTLKWGAPGYAAVAGAGTPLYTTTTSCPAGCLFVGSNDGYVVRIDATNGNVAAQHYLGAPVVVSDTTYDRFRQALYVVSNGVLYSLDANGTPLEKGPGRRK